METPEQLFRHASETSKKRLATLRGRVKQSEDKGYGAETNAYYKKEADAKLEKWYEGYLNRMKKNKAATTIQRSYRKHLKHRAGTRRRTRRHR